MKIRKIFFRFLIVAFLFFLIKGYVYRTTVKYEAIETRKEHKIKNQKLIEYIEEGIEYDNLKNVQNIIDISLSKTSKLLSFTNSKSYTNPNKLIEFKKANCVGYSTLFSSICNQLLYKNRLFDWKAKTYKGQLDFLGINIHNFFSSSFFKNHDFVIIKNEVTNEIITVDPSLYDYIHINRVSMKVKDIVTN